MEGATQSSMWSCAFLGTEAKVMIWIWKESEELHNTCNISLMNLKTFKIVTVRLIFKEWRYLGEKMHTIYLCMRKTEL